MQYHLVERKIVPITTTGNAGVATGTAYSVPVQGFLVGVHLDFHASAPATTDTTISDAATGRTILTITNSATDAFYPVMVQAVGNTGSVIAGVYQHEPIDGEIKIVLVQCDALTDAVIVTLYIQGGP